MTFLLEKFRIWSVTAVFYGNDQTLVYVVTRNQIKACNITLAIFVLLGIHQNADVSACYLDKTMTGMTCMHIMWAVDFCDEGTVVHHCTECAYCHK